MTAKSLEEKGAKPSNRGFDSVLFVFSKCIWFVMLKLWYKLLKTGFIFCTFMGFQWNWGHEKRHSRNRHPWRVQNKSLIFLFFFMSVWNLSESVQQRAKVTLRESCDTAHHPLPLPPSPNQLSHIQTACTHCCRCCCCYTLAERSVHTS